jgi:hypothetical protein
VTEAGRGDAETCEDRADPTELTEIVDAPDDRKRSGVIWFALELKLAIEMFLIVLTYCQAAFNRFFIASSFL